jgi:hypothetical protein
LTLAVVSPSFANIVEAFGNTAGFFIVGGLLEGGGLS